MEDNDAQSQLKKRARRRLVGAVTFASVVAIVLPILMDHQPRQVVDEVEIRIPGQDDKPFAPKFSTTPAEKAAPQATEPPADSKPAEGGPVEAGAPSVKVIESPKEKPEEKVAEKEPEKSAKAAPKSEKPEEKIAEKPKAGDSSAEARRAAAILAGQSAVPSTAPNTALAKSGDFVILIGAFANENNVRNLRTKLSERGVKTYTEALDSPGGRKTRVRAGPFESREAAEKALERMKQIGVSGVISTK
ncbi:MAG: SPOR domain-containing protein [Azonexus sp.]